MADSRALIENADTVKKNASEAAAAQLEIRRLETAVTSLQTAMEAERNHLDSMKALLKQVAQKRKQKKLAKYLELLEEVRGLAHRSSIPQVVSRRFLNQLMAQINSYLGQFDAPFKSTVSDDLSFRALMNAGATVPAAALSGGQKAGLSAAFWLSVFQANAGQTAISLWDEPGDGLDAPSRRMFNGVLSQVDEILRTQERQLIIVSHDSSLTDLFHCIQL